MMVVHIAGGKRPNGLYEARMVPLVLPYERALDIDNPRDYKFSSS